MAKKFGTKGQINGRINQGLNSGNDIKNVKAIEDKYLQIFKKYMDNFIKIFRVLLYDLLFTRKSRKCSPP
jgi:hypothetical protein